MSRAETRAWIGNLSGGPHQQRVYKFKPGGESIELIERGAEAKECGAELEALADEWRRADNSDDLLWWANRMRALAAKWRSR